MKGIECEDRSRGVRYVASGSRMVGRITLCQVQEFVVRFHDMMGLAGDVVWWCWQEKWEAGGPRKHAAS